MIQTGFTPKGRMLNAYRGLPVDRFPVAPEFWYYYPARLLGVDMIAFERDVPFWQALKTTFTRWSCEGWGAAFGAVTIDGARTTKSEERIEDGRYRQTTRVQYKGREFVSTQIFDVAQPSSVETFPVKSNDDLIPYLDMLLSDDVHVDYTGASTAHHAVGESYLLEYWLGLPFFDWVAEAMGFEQAIMWVVSVPEDERETLRQRYTEWMTAAVRDAIRETPFESLVIGCSSSCNSLLGPRLWRVLDKPVIAAVAREVHAAGKVLHIHFHGRSMEAVSDFVEMGVDCVCPFERPPGGDVEGLDGLRAVRAGLAERVTFNGNVHTVNALIRGAAEDVRREVREIKQAFADSRRCIIGTGDQVGRETPEENLSAMMEEAMRP